MKNKKYIFIFTQSILVLGLIFALNSTIKIKSVQWQDYTGKSIKKGFVEKEIQLVSKTQNMGNEELVFTVFQNETNEVVYEAIGKVVNNTAKITWTYHYPEKALSKIPEFYFKVKHKNGITKKSKKIKIVQNLKFQVLKDDIYSFVEVTDNTITNGIIEIEVPRLKNGFFEKEVAPGQWFLFSELNSKINYPIIVDRDWFLNRYEYFDVYEAGVLMRSQGGTGIPIKNCNFYGILWKSYLGGSS